MTDANNEIICVPPRAVHCVPPRLTAVHCVPPSLTANAIATAVHCVPPSLTANAIVNNAIANNVIGSFMNSEPESKKQKRVLADARAENKRLAAELQQTKDLFKSSVRNIVTLENQLKMIQAQSMSMYEFLKTAVDILPVGSNENRVCGQALCDIHKFMFDRCNTHEMANCVKNVETLNGKNIDIDWHLSDKSDSQMDYMEFASRH